MNSDNKTPSLPFLMNQRFHIWFLLFFSILIIFVKLGGNGLANYDDCFYAQKAKEILKTGSWLTMHYNNQPAFENPPLYMWLVALSYKIFGISEYAAKFPSAIFGVATILLIYLFAKKMVNSWTAFTSAFILSTTYVFIRYARHAMIDVSLTFFFCVAMLTFYFAIEKNRKYFLLWGIAIAACILAKSILGFFPLVVSVVALLLTKRWKMLFDPYFILGSLIALGLGSIWYIHEFATFGKEFSNIHFGWLIIQRGLYGNAESWSDHLSYFDDLVSYYWPWLPLLALGIAITIKNIRTKNTPEMLLLAWFFIPLLIMSLASTRVLWYIMPIFPAAAIIQGNALNRILSMKWKENILKASLVFGIVLFIIIIVFPVNLEANREQDIRVISPYVKHFASRGAKVIAFRQDYYGLNNALLFYSDYAALPLFQEYQELSKAMNTRDTVLCLISTDVVTELTHALPNISILRATQDLVLISNTHLDISSVKTW